MSESERRQRTISSTPRLTADEVASRSFPTAFRGISETDVRAFLKRVAEDLGAVRAREHELMGTIDELEARLRTPRPLDEHELLDALGEETTRLLRSAREAATDIRGKAEARATRLVHDAHEEAQRVRQEAQDVLGVRTHEADTVAHALLEEAEQRASDLMRVADERAAEVRAGADRYAEELRARVEREATTAIESAREQGRALIEEAASLRERIIDDLAGRRELLSGQLEELRTGRDGLLDAYRVVKRTFLEATEALAQVEARATASRPIAGTDPTDLADSLAAETEAARAVGLEPAADGAAADASADAEAAAADVTDEDEAAADDATDAPAPDAVPAHDSDGDGDGETGPNLADVDDLFARLRAGAEAEAEIDLSSEPPAIAEVDATTGDSDPAPPASADVPSPQPAATPAPTRTKSAGREKPAEASGNPAWLTRRNEVLAPLRVALVRQVKLAIGNEQNEVLDRVRRHKGRIAAAAALPEIDAQVEAWAAVVSGAISQAYRFGLLTSADGAEDLTVADADAALPDDLAATLARALVEPLRDRLVSAIDTAAEPGETSAQVAERIGARYREWKNRSAESSTEDALVAAYARGHYDSAADGSVLAWCVPPAGCCVDCADNALEPTRKGEDFPTGQPCPPAHAGCRCALTIGGADADPSESAHAESTSRG